MLEKSPLLLEEPADCLWLLLDSKRVGAVFKSRFLRDLDWKTRGLVSRLIKQRGAGMRKTVFLSLGSHFPQGLCAVDTLESFNAKAFTENVSGLKAKKLILVYESEKVRKGIEARICSNEIKRIAPESIFYEDQI